MSIILCNLRGKNCGSCRYWSGERSIEFRCNTPYCVKADSKPATCLAYSGRNTTPGSTCPRHAIWEKL